MSTSPSSNARRMIFPAKQQVLVESFDPGSPGNGESPVQTELSLMSTGTENIVFNRLFDPGTHWDQWVRYPFYPGYSCVGVVEKLGEGVASLHPGERVAARVSHCSSAVVAEADVLPVPKTLA